MTIDEFEDLVTKARREHPVWFGLESDAPASEEELTLAERALDAKLPDEYREFVKRFGGGYFAFANVFSVASDSHWSIVRRNVESASLTGDGFVAASDNGVGDYYGFRVHDGACESRVSIFDHGAGEIMSTEFGDLLEFLARKALTGA